MRFSGRQLGGAFQLAPRGATRPMYLEHQRDQREQASSDADREGRDRLVFVVEDLDMQRHGVGLAADGPTPPRPRRTRPWRAHCTGSPCSRPHLMLGRVTPEGLPAGGASTIAAPRPALRLHQRDQLARDEGEGHEHGGQDDARHGEDDLDVVRLQPGPNSPGRRTPAGRSGRRPPARPRTAGRSAWSGRLLPRNSNLAIAQAAAMPNTSSAAPQPARQQRQADRRPGVGVLSASK